MMRKRILSILLCLVMVVGLFPTMAFAADGSGATTGSGTASDPYIVTTFDELKAELEKDTVGLGMQYIKVPSGTNIEKVLKLDAYASAIEIQRQKTLIVDGTVTVTGGATSGSVVRSLLHINGSGDRLDIKGKGSLTFEANANGATNAVVDVENNATVNISGGVTLTGAYNLATYGIAVYNYGGTVNIDNATLEGKTGGVSYGAAIYAIKGTTNIKNATLKSSVLPGASITKKEGGTIFIDEDATLTIENSIIHTTDGVTDGHSIYLHQGNTKHIADYLGTNQKIYTLSDNTPLSADVSSLTDSVNITDNISKVIDTISLTVNSPNERKTLSDLECDYSPKNKMVLSNFIVYKGLNNTSDKIEDNNTPYDPNEGYTVMYVFTTKEGFSFASNIEENVSISGGDFWMADDFGGSTNKLRVFVNFPSCEIDKVNLTIKPKDERTKISDLEEINYSPANGMTLTNCIVYKGLNNLEDKINDKNTPYYQSQSYTAMYVFATKEGFSFASNIKENVSISGGDFWEADTLGGLTNKLRVFVNFPAKAAEGPNYVTEAAVQVAAPVAGEKPKGTVDIPVLGDNKDKVKKATMWWSGMLSGKTAFVAGQEYTAIVELAPKEGVTFADNMKLKVNGKVADLLSKDPTDGSVQFKVKFTAVDPSTPTTYAVTVTSGGNGTVSANLAKAVAGTEIELTATPNSGYHFKEWQVIKGGVTVKDNKFTMPAAEVEIKAIFEKNASAEYTVKFDGNGGKASKDEMTTNNQKLAKLPDATRSGKYQFDGWYMKKDGGTKITTATVFDKNTTVYAHWTYTGGGSSGGGGGSSGGGGVTTYAITVQNSKNGTVTASHKSAAKDTAVTLTVTPDKGYVLDTLTVLDSKDKAVKLTEKNGKYTFTMPAGKVTVSAAFKAAAPASENPFTDVPSGAYYEDAVIWAVKKGITSGTSATTFNPDGSCTRAQAVTFLWRAAGSPEPKSAAMPFTDVPAGSYFEKAVLWAVENRITKGTSDTTFGPDASCTRAQIVTFLWRAGGSPAVSGNSAFSDVAADAYYAAAVAWAEKNGVTGGIGGGLFGSDNTCTRAQIVTFLHRAMK